MAKKRRAQRESGAGRPRPTVDPEAMRGRSFEGMTSRELASKARWRVSRGRIDEAVALFLGAAAREREVADPAVSREKEFVGHAGCTLAKAGRLDEAVPLLREALRPGRPRSLIEGHVRFELMRAAAATGDAAAFEREFDAACEACDELFPWIYPHMEALLDTARALEQWRVVGHVVGAMEHFYGTLPRKLARRVADARGRIPEARRNEFEYARANTLEEGAKFRERLALPPKLPPKPDCARSFDPALATKECTRGLFLALTPSEYQTLRRYRRDADRRAHVRELEERWPAQWRCETDKAWRFLNLLLADRRTSAPKTELFFAKRLHRAYYHVLTTLEGETLQQVAKDLAEIDESELQRRYMTWSAAEFHHYLGKVFIPDFDYLRYWYARVRDFIQRSANACRCVIFDAEA